MQEYVPGIVSEKREQIKLRKKMSVRKDIITGAEQKDTKAAKFHIEPASKTGQTYYNMLVTQVKPFNNRKGSLVTSDRIQRLDSHQKFRCLVPTDYQINPMHTGPELNAIIKAS